MWQDGHDTLKHTLITTRKSAHQKSGDVQKYFILMQRICAPKAKIMSEEGGKPWAMAETENNRLKGEVKEQAEEIREVTWLRWRRRLFCVVLERIPQNNQGRMMDRDQKGGTCSLKPCQVAVPKGMDSSSS